MEEELDLFELFDILKKRWKFLFVLVFVAAITAAVVSSYILNPVYEAEATVVFKQTPEKSTPMVLTETAVAPYANLSALDPVLEISMNNRIEIYKSRAVISRVINKLGLPINVPSNEYNSLLNNITIEPIKGTTGIRIKVQSQSPKQAKDIANAILSEGAAIIEAQKKKELDKAHDFIASQLQVVSARLGDLEEELKEAEGTRASEIKRQISTNEQLYTLLSQKLLEMQVVKADRLDEIEFLQEAVEPINPIKPKTELNVVIAAFLALFVGVFVVFIQHAFESRGTI